MATNAKIAFDANIQRAKYFLDLHEATQSGAGAPTLPRRELPRGAIVFTVGAVDAYLCEVSAEILVQQVHQDPARSALRDTLTRVQREIPSLALEVALLDTQPARLSRIHDSIVEYFQNQTSQFGARGVSATITRLGGNPADVWSTLVKQGHSNPQQLLDRWTDVRHEIVHQGKKSRVWRPHARVFINFAKDMVARIDSVVTTLVP